jgi:hypothetical protein
VSIDSTDNSCTGSDGSRSCHHCKRTGLRESDMRAIKTKGINKEYISNTCWDCYRAQARRRRERRERVNNREDYANLLHKRAEQVLQSKSGFRKGSSWKGCHIWRPIWEIMPKPMTIREAFQALDDSIVVFGYSRVIDIPKHLAKEIYFEGLMAEIELLGPSWDLLDPEWLTDNVQAVALNPMLVRNIQLDFTTLLEEEVEIVQSKRRVRDQEGCELLDTDPVADRERQEWEPEESPSS